MGADKFQLTLAKGALGGPPVNFPLDECRRIVQLYRRDNFKIVAGWKNCASWIEHMANPHAEPTFYKCLEIGHGYIRLPNGMSLKYPELRKSVGEKGWDEWSYQSGAMRKKIYGGLLCENLVQALARIIKGTGTLAYVSGHHAAAYPARWNGVNALATGGIGGRGGRRLSAARTASTIHVLIETPAPFAADSTSARR